MKLKGKLIMSAAALAACAATLTSTTYAWYTSNTQVSADGVTGTTAASGSELLLISDTGKDGSWSNTVTLDSNDQGNVNINGVNLMPVAHAAEGEYKGWSGNAVSTDPASSTNYLQFDLFFKATKELPVYVNGFTINNTTKALPSKDILANAGGLEASDKNKTYTVDVRRALKVETKSEVVTKGTAATPSYEQYNLSNLNLNKYEDSLKGLSSYNAHTYFNTVTGNHIATEVTTSQSVASTEIKETGKDKWTLGTTPLATEAGEATYLKVTFIVYLDGWDLACFDACQGQSISIALNFTCEAGASGMLYTA